MRITLTDIKNRRDKYRKNIETISLFLKTRKKEKTKTIIYIHGLRYKRANIKQNCRISFLICEKNLIETLNKKNLSSVFSHYEHIKLSFNRIHMLIIIIIIIIAIKMVVIFSTGKNNKNKHPESKSMNQ